MLVYAGMYACHCPHLVFGDVVSHSSCFSKVMRYAAISCKNKHRKVTSVCVFVLEGDKT